MIQNNGQNEFNPRMTIPQASFSMPRLATSDILTALDITVKQFDWSFVARSGVLRGSDAPVWFGPTVESARTELLVQVIGRLDYLGPRIMRALARRRVA